MAENRYTRIKVDVLVQQLQDVIKSALGVEFDPTAYDALATYFNLPQFSETSPQLIYDTAAVICWSATGKVVYELPQRAQAGKAKPNIVYGNDISIAIITAHMPSYPLDPCHATVKVTADFKLKEYLPLSLKQIIDKFGG